MANPTQDPRSAVYSNTGQGYDASKDPMVRAAADPNAELRKQYMNALAWQTALPAAATVGQYAAMAWPTEQDKRNKEKLALLNEAHDAGKLAQTPQAKIIEHQRRTGQAALGASGREAQMQAGQRFAASGQNLSAADVRQIQEMPGRVTAQGEVALANAETIAKLEEMGRQIDEAESRTAYEAERKKQNRQWLAQMVGQGAQVAGTIAAARATKKVDWGSINDPTAQLMYLRAFGGQGGDENLQSMLRSTPTDV